jgi:hypothetical protein
MKKIIDQYSGPEFTPKERYKLRHPELYKAQSRNQSRRWRSTHPEQSNQTTKEWRAKNKTKFSSYRKERNIYLLECRNQLMIILNLYE